MFGVFCVLYVVLYVFMLCALCVVVGRCYFEFVGFVLVSSLVLLLCLSVCSV